MKLASILLTVFCLILMSCCLAGQILAQGSGAGLEPDSGSASGSGSVSGTEARPVFLQGGVEHAERLDPVAPSLRAGAIFNQQALPAAMPNNDWYWIPFWFAGHKHVDYATILRDYDFQTGASVSPNKTVMSRQDLSIGFQADRNGQVWEFKRAPYSTTIERDSFFTTMMVSKREPIKITQDLVILRLVETSVNVDKSSQRILKTEQEEQINTYVPAGNGLIRMQASIKTFGPDGSPQIQELSSRIIENRAPFQPVDYYQGLDMRMLFRNYLLSHGFANLLPQDLSAPAN